MSNNPYQMFKTDPKMETEGIIIDYDLFRVVLARSGGANKKYKQLLQARMKPYRRQIANETLSEEVAERIVLEVFVETCILNWYVKKEKVEGDINIVFYEVGIHMEDGTIEEPIKANILKVLDSHPELSSDLQEQANKVALFRHEELDEDAGNS